MGSLVCCSVVQPTLLLNTLIINLLLDNILKVAVKDLLDVVLQRHLDLRLPVPDLERMRDLLPQLVLRLVLAMLTLVLVAASTTMPQDLILILMVVPITRLRAHLRAVHAVVVVVLQLGREAFL